MKAEKIDNFYVNIHKPVSLVQFQFTHTFFFFFLFFVNYYSGKYLINLRVYTTNSKKLTTVISYVQQLAASVSSKKIFQFKIILYKCKILSILLIINFSKFQILLHTFYYAKKKKQGKFEK